MSYDYQIEDGGIQLKGTVYKDLTVGAGGDTERLVVEATDTASNTTVIAGGAVVALGGRVYETVLKADDARLDLICSDGTNFASSVNTKLTSNAVLVVSSGCLASATSIVGGGFMTVADFGSARLVNVGSGGTIYVNSGSVASEVLVASGGVARLNAGSTTTNLTVKDGGAAWLYSNVTIAGSLDIYGAARILGTAVSASGLKVNFHLETHLPVASATTTITPFVDASISNFTGASFSVTLSNSQSTGLYVISSATTAFTGSITIKNMLGETLTTLSLGETKVVSTGTYTLAINNVALNPRYPTTLTSCLTLNVTTTAGNVTWPYAWPSAPITVKAVTSSSFTFGSDSSYLTANGYAGSLSGNFGTISGGTVTQDLYLNLNGAGSAHVMIGGTGNNYIYLNNAGMIVKSLYGADGTDAKSVNMVIAQGKAAALVAAGQNTKILGDVNIEFSSGNAIVQTANIYGGAIAATKASAVEGSVNLTFTGASLNGLVFAAGRAQDGQTSEVKGDVTVTLSGATHTANSKITAGPTNWVVGGGMAVGGSTIIVDGTITINVVDSNVGYLVAGGMAQDQNSTSIVSKSVINLSGATTVGGNIYGGGYVAKGGFATVDESILNINAAKGNTITIEGNIYAGAANPYKNGTATVWDSTIVVGGSGANLIFDGIIDGGVSTGVAPEAASELVFSAFKGVFAGAIQNFTTLSFIGNTVTNLTNGTASANNFVFDMNGRTKANYGSSMADSDFKAADASAIEVDLYAANLASATTFALMDVLDDTILGCATSIYKDDVLLGTISFGGSLTAEGSVYSTKIVGGVAVLTYAKA